MTPQHQPTDSSCFAACLATLLDIPIALVPNFNKPRTGWAQMKAAQEWLARLGWTLIECEKCGASAVPCYCIATVRTPGWTSDHAVVARLEGDKLKVVFDPWPGNSAEARHPRERFVAVAFLVPAIADPDRANWKGGLSCLSEPSGKFLPWLAPLDWATGPGR